MTTTTTTTTTTTEPKRELMAVVAIADWEANPRRGEYRGIEEFAAQIQRDGGIKEDLHVFSRNGVITAMQGHRRKRACPLIGIETVWVKNYGAISDREAFEILLSLQNGCDPFDARELAIAARTAVHEMGMTASEVAHSFHREEKTVQLYLSLETLPHRVQEAVYSGQISLGLAELFRQLPTKAMQEKALGEVLVDAMLNAPMSAKQAEVHITENYLKAIRREKEWVKLKQVLLKKHKLSDGFSFVEFDQRAEFVMSESLPEEGYARAEEHVAGALLNDPGEPVTWGQLASVYGVPVFVVPAMALGEKYLLLVKVAAVKDADGVADAPRLRGKAGKVKKVVKPEEEGGEQSAVDGETVPEEEVQPQEEGAFDGRIIKDGVCSRCCEIFDSREEQVEHLRGPLCEELVLESDVGEPEPEAPLEPAPFPMARIDRVWAVLIEEKTKAMGDCLWKELEPVILELLALNLPGAVFEALRQKIKQDSAQLRRGMRVCLVGLLALSAGGYDRRKNGALEDFEYALNLPPVE